MNHHHIFIVMYESVFDGYQFRDHETPKTLYLVAVPYSVVKHR